MSTIDGASPTHPNVLLVHCHDLGRYLGCYGRDVETPNIDALANRGTRFEECYCTAPQCTPSRGSMLTGNHPNTNGLLGLVGWTLDADQLALPQYLAAAGYETHHFGGHFLNDTRERLGYDHRHDGPHYAHDAADAVTDFLGSDPDGPFLATVGFEEPHRPYRRESIPTGAYDQRERDGVASLPYLPDHPGVREDVAALQVLIERTIDPALGQIDDALAAGGMLEETLVVFTTDHGVAMPRAKGSCYDPGIETALLVAQPGRVAAGTVTELCSNVDLLPTILEHVGATDPVDGVDPLTDLDGRSFAPLLDDNGAPGRDTVYSALTWHDRYHPIRAVRTKRYKYVRNFAEFPRVYLPLDTDRGPAANALRREFTDTPLPAEELYDLAADPHEGDNLAPDRRAYEPQYLDDVDPVHRSVLQSLRENLQAWMHETGDPLVGDSIAVSPPKRW